MKNLSIFWKIFVIVVILSIAMVFIGGFGVATLRSKTIEKTEQNLKALAENSAGEFWNFINNYIQFLEYLSNEESIKSVFNDELYSEQVLSIFERVIKSHPDVLFAYIGLKDKRMYLVPNDIEEGDEYNPIIQDWYKAAISKQNQVVITEPYQDTYYGKPVTLVTVAKAIQTQDGIIGVLGIDFECSKLANQLLQKGKELGYLHAVVSENGTIILHSVKDYVGKSVKDTEFFKKWQTGPESGVFGYVYDNTPRITGYKRLPNGWIYATVVPEKVLMSEVNKLTLIFAIIIALAIIISIVFALIISRRYIVKPLKELSGVAEKIAQGDLTVSFSLDTKDEIGKLGNVLSSMVTSLRGMAQRIQEESNRVKKEANQVAAVSEEVSATIEELTAQVDSVGSNVNNASAAIEQLTSGIEEVAASAQNVANASQKLSEEAQRVSTLANEGQKAILSIADVITQTKEKANTTFETVEKLSDSAKNIGEIVDTINSIAEQTNLLALNAAIEAARAGEAGRGFAVVADEIRKLAEESKQATQNIANILKGILDESVKASEATKETVEIVNQAAGQSNLVKGQFDQILNSILKMSQMVENLAASAQEQSAAAEEMSSAMDSASRSMVEVVEQMNEVTMAVKQQADAISTVARAAEKLDDIAEKLVEEVKKFKI